MVYFNVVLNYIELLETLGKTINDMIKKFPDEMKGTKSGVIAVVEMPESGKTTPFTHVIGEQVGDVEYHTTSSVEKAERTITSSYEESFSTKNLEQGKKGGGFFINGTSSEQPSFAIGFSGLTELMDALLCLIVLLRMRKIDYKKAHSLAKRCKNQDGKLDIFLQTARDKKLF